MVGGMISSTVLTLAVIPALYALVKQWELQRALKRAPAAPADAQLAASGAE
jgi:Cu(I)/Ag(I) efflux system membrane protein CusA/SilA